MITKEQLVNGIIKYIDCDVMPSLPTHGKWIAGTVLMLASNKYTEMLTELLNHPLIKVLGVVEEGGLIDADTMLTALKQSAQKYGCVELNLPIIGTLRFNDADVDKLRMYVCGGTVNGNGITNAIN